MELRFFPEPKDDEREIREITQAFVNTRLRPTAIEDDAKSLFRREVFNELTALGLQSLSVPKNLGGRGLRSRCQFAALEEIARGSVSMAITVGVNALPQGALIAFGNKAQQETFLAPLVKGEWLGAFSLSEPQSGSDAAALLCSAKHTNEGYVLNGTKIWCSTAGHADVYLIIARTSEERISGITAFIVTNNTPGFRIGKIEKKLGLHASSLAELVFEDCFIPESQRLGKEGEGFAVALSQIDSGRITIGAAGVALCIEAIARAWSFLSSQDSVLFGSGVRHALANRYAEVQALRNLVGVAADQKDKGGRITLLASQVKLLGSELAMKTTSEVVQYMGPEGCMAENEVERLMRDAKALQIVEGTSQIQREVISREMDKMVKT